MSRRTGRAAAGLMLAAAVLAGLDAVIVRLLAGQVHPLVIGFFRALFGLLAVLPWAIGRVNLRASPWRWMHVLRAGLKLASLVAVFVAFAHAPLADAMALTFTMPLLVTLGAWAFLGESVGPGRLLGVIGGFAGILVIVRPGADFDPWLLFALGGAVLTAIIQLMLRHMSHADTTERLVAWNLIAMAPLGLLAALPVWGTPSREQLALLALQGAIGALNMTLITRAYGLADVSFLAPLDFLRLPVVGILAWLFFAELAPVSTWIGAAVIVASVLLSMRRTGP
ncbi:DMT family transporter [Paracoccus sediminis]|uniref:EamA-like transporter family protein n=1 Tax=Paracoccus sediminis TaxID=1214787 RepID=A0A238XSI8_9RHOB|nr:DMT family transporter [Paracoccus sediminis]SNR61538.1 EamA-like transporter family protein [Paracoccus sediminis]